MSVYFINQGHTGLQLAFLWHLDRQNLNIRASLRTKVMPLPG